MKTSTEVSRENLGDRQCTAVLASLQAASDGAMSNSYESEAEAAVET